MALGAEPAGVRALVLRQGMTPVLVGLALGLAAALALSRVLSTLLYQVSPTDPLIFAAAPLALALAALAACYVPALRATRIDPVSALRE
jgi:ABC-type antimicrobial peptide transport system permease subunit